MYILYLAKLKERSFWKGQGRMVHLVFYEAKKVSPLVKLSNPTLSFAAFYNPYN